MLNRAMVSVACWSVRFSVGSYARSAWHRSDLDNPAFGFGASI